MSVTRRQVIAAAAAASYGRILGANDRVGVGFVGYGLIGAQHVFDFKNQKDVDMVAMSDTYQPRMEQGIAACGGKAKGYRDFRKLLDDKDVQAVVVSTPDHWHCLMAMMACAAGKDVYVEKPLSVFVKEGRWLADVAKKHGRVVQVGTQQRSGRHYHAGREMVQKGHIGKVVAAKAGAYRNVMPGFGAPPDSAAPSDFDYDMWLGPAPKRPYNKHRGIYHFRWFWDYSGGQMTNLGAHSIDIVQWYLDLKGPARVCSFGGRRALEDNGETPDVQDAIFEYANGLNLSYSIREVSAGSRAGSALEFNGTKGSLTVERPMLRVVSDMKSDPANSIPQFKGHSAGGPQRVDKAPEPWTEALNMKGSSDEQFDLHVRNFLDAIKTRQKTVASAEDGHRTAVACHLANISLRTRSMIEWDPEKEQITNNKQAAAMLERPYRKPWDSVLKSLLS
jgi:predicted dehydrogenase